MAHHGEDAYERKLRPLYDALDARNYKQAMKLADTALKKYPKDQLVRALKGYALHRSGKADEALQLMREIVAEGPEAERVVMTMAYTFKAAGQPAGISQAYIAAAEKHPHDPDILLGLYKSYVREFNLVKQQQVAMKLSKLAPAGADGRASWWIVCSLALQARAALLRQDQQGGPLHGSVGGMGAEQLLQLAETMAARQAAAAMQRTPSSEQQGHASVGLTYEALLLYLDILQGRGKAQQALEVIDGPMGRAVPLPADRLQLRAAILMRMGDLPAAAACYFDAVRAAPDDWLSWQLYLDCMLPGSQASTGVTRFPVGVVGGLADLWDQKQQRQLTTDGEGVAASLVAVEESMRQLGEVVASDRWCRQVEQGVLRAPSLWRCELLLRKQRLAAAGAAVLEVAAAEELQQELVAAVGEAFVKLAANFSCVSDLRPYLALLNGTAAKQLAAHAHCHAADVNAKIAAGTSDETAEAALSNQSNGTSGHAASHSSSNSRGLSEEVRQMQRVVNAHQIELELGLPCFATPHEGTAHAAALLNIYHNHMHLSAELDEKDRGYGEELIAAAVEAVLVTAALEAQSALMGGKPIAQPVVDFMLQAVLVVEAAQQRRKVSAPLRLTAAALYSLLGCPKLAAAQFAALDIKSIQHDSMTGHWLLPLFAGCGVDSANLRRWVDGLALLHELHQQDAGETLATALEHGTYSKVPEFVDFKERLQHSHARALAATTRAVLGGKGTGGGPGGPGISSSGQCAALQHARQLLIAAAAGSKLADGEPSGNGPVIRFNEDLSTRPSWYPPASTGSGAVGDWWQALAQGRLSRGHARCWWAQPRAAEAAVPEAAHWRRQRLAELCNRVAWSFVVSASLASKGDAADLLAQIQPMLQQQTAEGLEQEAAHMVCSLQAAALAAVEALLAALVGNVALNDAAVQRLLQCCSAAAEHAKGELEAVGNLPVLPGSAMSAVAVASECNLAAAVYTRLQQLAATEPGLKAVEEAAGQGASAACAAAATVKEAVATHLQSASEEERVQQAMELLKSCSRDSSGKALWQFEALLDARQVVCGIVRDQLEVLRSMQP